MPTPDFILELRELVGTRPLWLSGVHAVVVRGEQLLLIRRADTGAWESVGGVIEPGEHPTDTAAREVAEEAGIVARAERIAGVDVTPPIVYGNGDVTQYLTVVVRLRWESGEPWPADGEATAARWASIDELDRLDPPMSEQKRHWVRWALADGEAGFVAAPPDGEPHQVVPGGPTW